MTIHKAQGVTIDRAHVMAERNMDRNLAYVALSRHREKVALYWAEDEMGSRRRFESVMARKRGKDTTLDYFDPPPELERLPKRGFGREL